MLGKSNFKGEESRQEVTKKEQSILGLIKQVFIKKALALGLITQGFIALGLKLALIEQLVMAINVQFIFQLGSTQLSLGIYQQGHIRHIDPRILKEYTQFSILQHSSQ